VNVVIYGSRADGHANVVLEVLIRDSGMTAIGLIDDWAENAARAIGDLRVLGGSADLPRLAGDGVEGVVLGFGAAENRASIAAEIDAAGLPLPTLVHPSAHVEPTATLGAGVQVMPGAHVGPAARVGAGCLLNTGSIVEHDASLGAGTVIDPGAILAGRVRVGREVEVGSGAVLIPDVEVADGAIVGAGAVVVRPVAASETVVGVPARPLRRS
jgi:UDP-perosamine 4-acetyltransferase